MQNAKKIYLIILSLCLSACSLFDDRVYDIKRTRMRIELIIRSDLPVSGRATWGVGWCKIELKQYPICLKHELRHCFEGYWHDEKPNGDDC